MKKIFFIICTLLLTVSASAQQEVNGVFYETDGSSMTASVVENYDFYQGAVVIPETISVDGADYTVTAVADFAFYDCGSLTSVTLPETVTSIGMYAFQNCLKLKSVNIPSNLTYLGEQAFGECAELNGINLPGTITEIGVSAFEGCTGLTDITLGEGIRNIPSTMFARCEALTSLTLPQSMETIGDWALSNCISLKELNLNEGLTDIAECALTFCYSLETLNLPSTLLTIGNNAFAHCTMLSEVTFPAGIQEIGYYVFDNCEMLGSIRCMSADPVKVTYDKILDYCDQTILYVPVGAKAAYQAAKGWGDFKECREIGADEQPGYRLKRIEDNGMCFIVSDLDTHFAKVVCKKDGHYTGDVDIPSSVTGTDGTVYTVNHIGEGAFELCVEMNSAVMPQSITSIGEWAFSGCQAMSMLEIPESVTKIGDNAFFGCASIADVTLHNTLTYIGEGAFGGCFSLLNVYSEIEDPFIIAETTFDFIEEQTLYVPKGCKQDYKSTDFWWRFNNIVEDEQLSVGKVITENGNGDMYDLQGRKVVNPVKGSVYIRNNKKVVF